MNTNCKKKKKKSVDGQMWYKHGHHHHQELLIKAGYRDCQGDGGGGRGRPDFLIGKLSQSIQKFNIQQQNFIIKKIMITNTVDAILKVYHLSLFYLSLSLSLSRAHAIKKQRERQTHRAGFDLLNVSLTFAVHTVCICRLHVCVDTHHTHRLHM